MAATPTPSLHAAAGTIFRAVGLFDVALGIAMAVFGELVVPLGEIMPGLPTWWLVGGLLALSGLGIAALGIVLDRRQRAVQAPPADDTPVQRG